MYLSVVYVKPHELLYEKSVALEKWIMNDFLRSNR